MDSQSRHSHFTTVLLIGLMVTAVTIGSYFQIPQSFIIIFMIVVGLILATVLLWRHANSHADGSEWWQDDSASGWRGY